MFRYLAIALSVFVAASIHAQSTEYITKKKQKLSRPSPFENIISDSTSRELIYDDGLVVAFEPLRKQAPVHLLIVPKKRIPTINDLNVADSQIISRLFLAARALAAQYKIDESGYRLALNTNEDAGQSVFHIHMHLLGGMKLGPMMSQTYQDKEKE